MILNKVATSIGICNFKRFASKLLLNSKKILVLYLFAQEELRKFSKIFETLLTKHVSCFTQFIDNNDCQGRK